MQMCKNRPTVAWTAPPSILLKSPPAPCYLFMAIISSNVQRGEENRILNVHISSMLQKNIDSLEEYKEKFLLEAAHKWSQAVKQDFKILPV